MLTALQLLEWPTPLDPDAVAACCCWLGNPLPKARPRFVDGRAVTPTTTRAYEKSIRSLLRAETRLRPADTVGRFGLRCVFHRRTRLLCDLDNLVKALLDGAQGAGVFAFDSQIHEIHARLVMGSKSPRVEMVFYRLE